MMSIYAPKGPHEAPLPWHLASLETLSRLFKSRVTVRLVHLLQPHGTHVFHHLAEALLHPLEEAATLHRPASQQVTLKA